jgi:amidohydrolase
MAITHEPAIVTSLISSAIAFRHDLHRHPELAYKEVQTSQRVAEWLSGISVEFVTGLAGGTGVLGWLPATEPDAPTIALRADMDALPILEATGVQYSSTREGVMHACGHDGHTATLAATAAALARTPVRRNNVLFVFQPAEEGGAGGKRMVEDGALTGKVLGKPADTIYGLHCSSIHEVGTVCTCDGPMLASATQFHIEVKGAGGHAAAPHLSIDPTVIAAQILLGLQTIASRGVDPLDSVVVTVPMIHGGSAHNVIPESVMMTGTLRTLKETTREFAMRRIPEIANGIATAMGGSAETHYEDNPYPVTMNDLVPTARFRKLIAATPGIELLPDGPPVMGGEDFSFYGNSGVPACFYWLGIRPKGMEKYPNVHTPTFNFNDEALEYGVRAMTTLTLAPLHLD